LLISKLGAKFGDNAIVSAVHMPSSYKYNYNPEKEIEEALAKIMVS